MSHSTTVSSTHVLVKYSRSYPSSGGAQTQSADEWQHFTSPIIRVALDVRKSSGGELESVRMRIVWEMNAGDDGMNVEQQEVVLEDMDLLSYSSLPASQQASLPLKAVYRDAVIGIRYRYPRIVVTGSSPNYRRFQIAFRSSAAASDFIDSISHVCPCKGNPPPAPQRGGGGMIPPSGTINSQSRLIGRTGSVAYPPSTPTSNTNGPSRVIPFSRNTSMRPMSAMSTPSSRTFSAARMGTTTPVTPSFPVNAQGRGLYDDFSSNGAMGMGMRMEDALMDQHTRGVDIPESSPMGPPSTDLPSAASLFPSSSSNPGLGLMLPPPPPPSSAESAVPQTEFIDSLRAAVPSLYTLPKAELEALVGDVVREEGFAKLLENLDSMWKVKGFLGR